MRTFLRLPLAMMIALGAITGVHAQSKDTRTVLPVWNKGSGKVEALLYLEPTGEQAAGARWHFGRNSLDAAFGLSSGDSLGLLCSSSGTSMSGQPRRRGRPQQPAFHRHRRIEPWQQPPRHHRRHRP